MSVRLLCSLCEAWVYSHGHSGARLLVPTLSLVPPLAFTAEEVKAHTRCERAKDSFDLWLVIDNKVYDVSTWGTHSPLLSHYYPLTLH